MGKKKKAVYLSANEAYTLPKKAQGHEMRSEKKNTGLICNT